jgi:hypothetical protein
MSSCLQQGFYRQKKRHSRQMEELIPSTSLYWSDENQNHYIDREINVPGVRFWSVVL